MSRGRLSRYVLVGALATAVHYAVLVVAVETGHWPARWAAALGAVVGAQVAYAGNRRFTFGHRGPWGASWVRFQAVALVGAVCSMSLVGLVQALGGHYLVGQVLATLVAMGLTYLLNRRWSFATGAQPDAPPPPAGHAGSPGRPGTQPPAPGPRR